MTSAPVLPSTQCAHPRCVTVPLGAPQLHGKVSDVITAASKLVRVEFSADGADSGPSETALRLSADDVDVRAPHRPH